MKKGAKIALGTTVVVSVAAAGAVVFDKIRKSKKKKVDVTVDTTSLQPEEECEVE